MGQAFPLILAPFIGSFLGTLACRLPQGRPVLLGRSLCEACGTKLGMADLVPIASWLATGARCRHCLAAIAGFYPAIELAALGIAGWAAMLDEGPRLWAGCLLGWTLLAAAIIDWRHLILPDALTLPLLAAGLAFAAWQDAAALPDHLAGVVLGWGAFAGLGWAYRQLRQRDGLGAGDAKLLGATGAWVTWEGLPDLVLLAALGALGWGLVRHALGRVGLDARIAFGPWLAAAAWLVWLYR